MTRAAPSGATSEVADAPDCTTILRFITCGSVDDGKSTLIGRLLYDSKLIFDDQLSALQRDSLRYGTTGQGQLDLALLVDGLAAEREQGITIDVAYRFFATPRRTFIVADTPGHEQYTRNMVTGASTADLAVVLVDARKGLLQQTRRHCFLVSLLGIRSVVLAVNKMDCVDWSRDVFESIERAYNDLAATMGLPAATAIPLSALHGTNVTESGSAEMPWYRGPSLLGHLETVDIGRRGVENGFRLPVQWVNRPDQNFRGFAGTVLNTPIKRGDAVVVLPGRQTSSVARIVTFDGDRDEAFAGEAVTIVLDDDIDVVRGSVIAAAEGPPQLSDQFAAHIVWMSGEPLMPGRRYLLRIGTATVGAQITRLKYSIDVNTFAHLQASHLNMNEIALCNLALDREIPIESFRQSHELGGFILIDRQTNATLGCGMIEFPLRRASNIAHHRMKIDKVARASLKQQAGAVIWFTGLSGSGKSTIADLAEQELFRLGYHTMSLDGDNVRLGLNKDLGFIEEDRIENIRRVAEVARLMVEAGLIVLVSLISPFHRDRETSRSLFEEGEFFEVFVDTPLAVCEQRDPKNLYKKARAGLIPNFTGIDSPYERPTNPEMTLRIEDGSPEECAARIVQMVSTRLPSR